MHPLDSELARVAVEREREACAQLVEEPLKSVPPGTGFADSLRAVILSAAAAIRSRSGFAPKPLPSVSFKDGDEERVIFTLPPTDRPELPSVTVFAMPKSGSVLLDGIMRMLCDDVGLTYVSIMQEYFTIGLPPAQMPAETSEIFLPKGYCYGGFRHMPMTFDIPIVSQSRPVLLVRDPRDMLVSHYFSLRDSHPEPGRALKTASVSMSMRDLARTLDIDDYVMGQAAEQFRSFLAQYRTMLCAKHDVKVYRYEDIIYDKPKWVADLVAHFGWTVSPALIDAIAAHFNVIPDDEKTNHHIRQVHPGNYLKKLKPETIERLNDFFAEDMAFFGYQRG